MALTQAVNHLAVTLSGFGDFFDWRTLHFVGRCPTRNICTACGVLSSKVWITLCSHIFCPSCRLRIEAFGFRCPVDGKTINLENAALLQLSESSLADYRVQCINVGRGCKFEGPVANLKQHFLQRCGYSKAKCRRCDKELARWQALDHSAVCRVGLVPDAIRRLESVHSGDDCGRQSKSATACDTRRGINLAKEKLKRSPPAGKPTLASSNNKRPLTPAKPQHGIIEGAVPSRVSQPLKKEKVDIRDPGNVKNSAASEQVMTSTGNQSKGGSQQASHMAATSTAAIERAEQSATVKAQEPSFIPSTERDKAKAEVMSQTFSEVNVQSAALPDSRTEDTGDNRAVDPRLQSSIADTGAVRDQDAQSESLDSPAVSTGPSYADVAKEDSARACADSCSEVQIDVCSSKNNLSAGNTEVVGEHEHSQEGKGIEEQQPLARESADVSSTFALSDVPSTFQNARSAEVLPGTAESATGDKREEQSDEGSV